MQKRGSQALAGTCMETHMALQKLTMTKVMMVSHCSFVKAAMVAPEPVCNLEHSK